MVVPGGLNFLKSVIMYAVIKLRGPKRVVAKRPADSAGLFIFLTSNCDLKWVTQSMFLAAF